MTAPSPSTDRIPTGWRVIDELLDGGLPWRGLHEWFGVAACGEEARRTGARGGDPRGWFAPLGVLLHLVHSAWRCLTGMAAGAPDAHVTERAAIAGREGFSAAPDNHASGDRSFGARAAFSFVPRIPRATAHVLWIGQVVWPNPRCLVAGVRGDLRTFSDESSKSSSVGGSFASGGGDSRDASLLERSLFVETPDDPASRLWAVEQAIRSEDIRIIVADASGWPMAALRRLHVAMASRASPAFALLARPPNDATHLSMALTRWSVRPVTVTGDVRDGADIPELAIAWRVRLMRCRSSLLGSLRPESRRRLLADVLVQERPDCFGAEGSSGTPSSRPQSVAGPNASHRSRDDVVASLSWEIGR